jgi:S-adenosylmethionine-dependent methyltransferase
MAESGSSLGRFAVGVDPWIAGLGMVRDVVRQELVTRQITAHLPVSAPRLRVLDVGCGQGTQAVALARLGHDVVGVDPSEELLRAAWQLVGDQPDSVRPLIRFETGDLLALADRHRAAYDLVCCHGVVMYLPSLQDAVQPLIESARSGGLISLVTRNRAALAMRAGMSGKWTEAIEAFDARTYDNRLGIASVRADDPEEVQAALADAGATPIAWYGIRLFTDHWERQAPGNDLQDILAAEEEAGRRDPYRMLAALTHTIART